MMQKSLNEVDYLKYSYLSVSFSTTSKESALIYFLSIFGEAWPSYRHKKRETVSNLIGTVFFSLQ